ncbi:MAG: PAS domain S-box protein, partial [Desulfobacterales bacterium]|nr:PAS domain S-box protein [Desulfobacterales bacterium]
DLILLDIKMPGMDGFEVCKRLKADSQSKEIPIIFISALGETADKVKAFHAGGVDYITKPFQEKEVLMRVQTHIELHRMRINLESIVAERTLNLRMSEERFRMTFEQAAVGVAHVSLDGRFMRINQKLCDIVGYSKEEMQARSFQEITHPDDLDADLEYMKQVLDGEIKTYSMEKRYFRRNHEIVWINLTVSILLEETGEPKYFIAVIEDINNRKQAEEELNEQIQFQELVSRISTKFIGLSGVEFEQAIQGALVVIGRYFEVDTVRLYRTSLKGDALEFRLNWRSDNLAPPGEMQEIYKGKYPNLAAHYSRGESVVFARFEDSPEWPEMRKILKFFGTKAGVGVPLEIDDSGVDIFAMDKVLSEHEWSKDIIEHSKAIGLILLNAIRRREAEVEL